MSYLIPEEELMEATGYKSRARLEQHLADRSIWYEKGAGGRVYTTPAAFEAILQGKAVRREIDFA